MQISKSIKDLQNLEGEFQRICSSLVYPPGSLFRLAHQYLPNWGIKVTPENRDFIEAMSSQSYYEEWRRGSKESNDAIKRATDNAKLRYGNPDLNLELGFMASDLIMKMGRIKDTVTIADIGAGAGDTTQAILDFLDMHDNVETVVPKCHFYLLEPSIQRLAVAEEVLKKHSINSKGAFQYTLVASNHKSHLPFIGEQKFDMIVSNAVCHHMTFPDYLHQIREKLVEEGVVVIGDWHTTIWKHPAFVMELFEELGMSHEDLQKFEFLFRIKRGDSSSLEKELEPYQRESNRKMIDYEVCIAREFRMVPESSRLYFLEAHESLEDRIVKMAEAGLETDHLTLMKKTRWFTDKGRSINNLFPHSDFATVVAAARIREHKPVTDRTAIKDRIDRALIARG